MIGKFQDDLCSIEELEHNRKTSKWYKFTKENDGDWWHLNIGATGVGKSNNIACLAVSSCGREALQLKNWSWNAKGLLNCLSDPESYCNVMDEGSEAFFTREGLDKQQINNLKMAITNRAFNKMVFVNAPKIELLTGHIRDWFHSVSISYHKRFKDTLLVDKGYCDIYKRDAIPRLIDLLQDFKHEEEYLNKKMGAEEKIKIIQNKIDPSFSIKFPSLKDSKIPAFKEFWKNYYGTKLSHITEKKSEWDTAEKWKNINMEFKQVKINQYYEKQKQQKLREERLKSKEAS